MEHIVGIKDERIKLSILLFFFVRIVIACKRDDNKKKNRKLPVCRQILEQKCLFLRLDWYLFFFYYMFSILYRQRI